MPCRNEDYDQPGLFPWIPGLVRMNANEPTETDMDDHVITTHDAARATRPLFASIDEWCRLTGMGRTRTFSAIKEGLPAVKHGRRTLIDLERGVEWLRALPSATSKNQTAHST